jgi:hypothetical protein
MAYSPIYSGNNTYIPNHQASGSLVVGFSRNAKDFPLNNYIQIRKVETQVGYYALLLSETPSRVRNKQDYIWPDGEKMPEVEGSLDAESLSWETYSTTRYAYPFALGQLAVQQATWDVVASHAGIQASKLMTSRSNRVATVLTTAGNWGANTATATVASGSGGTWAASSATNQYIKKSLLYAKRAIVKATNGVAGRNLRLVIGPELASTISTNAEITDYLKASPFAMDVVKGQNDIGDWGLPKYLYGFELIVDDTVLVSNQRGASRSDAYVWPADKAVIMSRPGDLEGPSGAGPSFSTFTLFCMEEMTVEQKDDVDNRRILGRAVENCVEKLTAPASGFLLTGCS